MGALQTYYLGIDCGGTVTKAALYRADGAEAGVESVETELILPKPGHAERDMESMREAVFEVIRGVMRKTAIPPAQIMGVACCGHGKGLYLWGTDGRPARNAILSTDNRAYAYPVGWRKDGTEERVFQLSLQHIMACQPVSLLAWLKDHEPDVLGRTQWIFACKDYVRFLLTGEAFAELTDYSGANLLNLRTLRYDPELLACFGLSDFMDKLPPLRKSCDICGTVTAQAAQRTGLLEGTPVAGGMFDIDACAIAVNAVSEDTICAIAGTWSINEYIRRTPVTDGSVAMNSVFCDPDYYLIEESSPTSAGNNEWFIRTMLPEIKEEAQAAGGSIYERCNQYVQSVSPREFCPIFLPFLFASNVHPNAKSCFVGMMSYHTRAHMVRSVYEGIVYSHRFHIDRLLASRDAPPATIRLAGGVARSAVWSQMFADIMGIPVETVDVDETGTLGCAMCAAVATGAYASLREAAEHMVSVKARYVPDPTAKDFYEKRYRAYCRVIQALDPVWDDIQAITEL